MITSVNSTEHLNGSLFPFSFCAQGRISWPVVIRQNWAPQGLKWLLAQFMHVIGQRVQLPTPKVVSSLRKQPTSWSLALNCLSHSLFSGLSLDEIYTINLPIVFNVYFSLHASSLSDTSPPRFEHMRAIPSVSELLKHFENLCLFCYWDNTRSVDQRPSHLF